MDPQVGRKQSFLFFLSFPFDDDDTASHSGAQYPGRFENLAIAVNLRDACYEVRVEAISKTKIGFANSVEGCSIGMPMFPMSWTRWCIYEIVGRRVFGGFRSRGAITG